MRFLERKKYWWLTLSGILIVASIIAVVLWKIPLGIDFKGGAQLEVTIDSNPTEEALRQGLSSLPEVRGVTVNRTERGYLIRTLPISEEQHQLILEQLSSEFGQISQLEFQSVGPSVSQDLTRKAIWAVVLAVVLIVLYLAYSFSSVTYPISSWRFGLTAVAALLHDLIITVGVFAVLAKLFHYEIDASFITAMLTVLGFSVHDTIVVFDRIRESTLKDKTKAINNFEMLAEGALLQTLNRSLATSLTLILTLAALATLGGASIRPFILILLTGTVIGTYSSIFIATVLLVIWQTRLGRNSAHNEDLRDDSIAKIKNGP